MEKVPHTQVYGTFSSKNADCFQRLFESIFMRLTYGLSMADRAADIRSAWPKLLAISSGAPGNGMRILPISMRKAYSTRPLSSRCRIFILFLAALTNTNTSPLRMSIPMLLFTMPLRPLNPMRMFTGLLYSQ